jgi:hypothetical protein
MTDTPRADSDYAVECGCGWTTSTSAYGQAEREGMQHSDTCSEGELRIIDRGQDEVVYNV